MSLPPKKSCQSLEHSYTHSMCRGSLGFHVKLSSQLKERACVQGPPHLDWFRRLALAPPHRLTAAGGDHHNAEVPPLLEMDIQGARHAVYTDG